MKKNIITVILLLIYIITYAQIGIDTETPDVSSLLDISSTSKGILLPRMTTTQKNMIPSPAHSLLVYDTSLKCVSRNVGTHVSPSWICMTMYDKQFFYMPSINVDTDVLNAPLTKDLYAQYKTEFGTPLAKNPGASGSSILYYLSDELHYYVTYYDPAIIKINSISDSGVINYTILKNADFDAYMNIVFVVK